MSFQAYCFACEKKVSAITILDKEGLWQALDHDADIEVMHISEKGDHRWKLNQYEKERLREIKAEGSGLKPAK
jgi:hypothetical protein